MEAIYLHVRQQRPKKIAGELSAEILKRLKTDVQEKTGEAIEAAVITVPGGFQTGTCECTKKPGSTGLVSKSSPLLL